MRQPKIEITEDKWIPTSCSLCYAQCGIRVRRVNGIPVAIEGAPGSSLTGNGGICGKGIAGLHILHDPNRINYPVKRTNPEKGIGVNPKWKRITWEEALDEVTERLKRIRKENHSKVLFLTSPLPANHQNQHILVQLFRLAYGSKNYSPGGGGLHCGNASHFGAGMNHCSWSILPDYRYCNYALFFGCNNGVGAGHSFSMAAGLRAEAVERGMKVVSFDPLCHQSGAKATEWVPLLPGTDLAVLLAMANVIINEIGKYDVEYLKHKSNAPYLVKDDGYYVRDSRGEPLIWDTADGKAKAWDENSLLDPALVGEYVVDGEKCAPAFELIINHVKQYTPEWASGISTVSASTIRRIATEFIEQARIGSSIEIEGVKLPYRPVAAIQFRGGSGHTNGFHTYFAVDLLNQLAGAMDVPGGAIGWPAKCMGYPETGLPRWGPIATKDGLLTATLWLTSLPGTWPHPEPKLPERATLGDIFTCCAASTPFPFSSDSEELLSKFKIPYRIEMIMGVAQNTVMTIGQPETVAAFLKKVPFTVFFSIYHNETTEGFADIVLPDTCYFESLSCLQAEFFILYAPVGMSPWAYHLRQPVVEPLYERRFIPEVVLDISDRLGIKGEVIESLNQYLAQTQVQERFVGKEDISWEEINNRFLKWKFGKKHDLEWFKEHGFITWPKKPEEAYWRPFTDGRSSVYMEFILDQREKMKAICDAHNVKVNFEYYSPLLSWFPAVINTPQKQDCDLYAFSYKDALHTGAMTQGIGIFNDASRLSPYVFNILVHEKTAKEKGIKSGEKVVVENDYGHKTSGTVHTIQGIHPQCLAFMSGSGKWARGASLAKGKGANLNVLQELDLKHCCPITLNLETAARVKIYKANSKGSTK
jgi:anaerobic selenocysteine-containing dehydrogenase